MTEPTYQYIKGLGWQPFPEYNNVEVTFKNGERYLLQDRMPEIGDLCIWGWSGSGTFAVNHTKQPNLQGFADYIKHYGEIQFHTYSAGLHEEINRRMVADADNEVPCWVTVVKL